jgi:hypothetical protein
MIAPYQSLRDVPFRLYGSLRAVNLLLVPALQIDGARSAWRLARMASRASNSLSSVEPGTLQNLSSRKSRNLCKQS